ncbi:hypothetical protein HYH03_016703 [Edaphochlamys debaryana]|uniref:F-box domain-containing protein n=1 Tax=Edaphochlamys debaryana TaxID=47281 RepID=A0A835XJA1_9CHLO|nr:hypothetical protein HYH03_016703 [Edaphochlamys debaryana]|eukprot:KAG2484469.1 hypothetical protein HYH03_016703 [Edaphochlamys debaryana]
MDAEAAPSLPELALNLVGSFLSSRCAASCRLVCRQWRAAFTDSVEHVTIPVHLDPATTDARVASASAAFPAASSVTLLLPNCVFARCNPFDATGTPCAARAPLGRRGSAVMRAAEQRWEARQARWAEAEGAALQPGPGPNPGPGPPAPGPSGPAAGSGQAWPMPREPPGEGAPRERTPPREPGEVGSAALSAALTSVRSRVPHLRSLRIGDASRPPIRPGPVAAHAACLRPDLPLAAPHGLSTADAPSAQARAQAQAQARAQAQAQALLDCVGRVGLRQAGLAGAWAYPASLVPPEGAHRWAPPQLDVAQHLGEMAVEAAHRSGLDLAPLGSDPDPGLDPGPAGSGASGAAAGLADSTGARPPPGHSDPGPDRDPDPDLDPGSARKVPPPQPSLQRLRCLDLCVAADLGSLPPALAAQLTGLRLLQLKDGAQVLALRALSGLRALELWCVEGGREAAYWTSAAPHQIRRALPLLAGSLTGLTRLALRELVAQVEPPSSVTALTSLPLLSSLSLELVVTDAPRQLAELCEALGEEEEEEEETSSGEEESSCEGEEEEEEEEEEEQGSSGAEDEAKAAAAAAAATAATGDPGSGSGGAAADPGSGSGSGGAAHVASLVADLDARGPFQRGTTLRRVVERGWGALDELGPMDLFSGFAATPSPPGTTPAPGIAAVPNAGSGAGSGADRDPGSRVQGTGGGSVRRVGLTALDLTFVGCGLLPGTWQGVEALGGSLTELSLRVGRCAEEERLVACLLSRLPAGRWSEGAFRLTPPCLAPLPRLRRLALDVPLDPGLARALAARGLAAPGLLGPTAGPTGPGPSAAAAAAVETAAALGAEAGVAGLLPDLESLELGGLPCLAVEGTGGASGLGPPVGARVGLALAPRPGPGPGVVGLAGGMATHRLRRLCLEGDLSGLLGGPRSGAEAGGSGVGGGGFEIHGSLLRACGSLAELRLAHRPEGRPARARLGLAWAHLPPRLEALGLEGLDVGLGGPVPTLGKPCSDTTLTLTADHSSDPSLPQLRSLRLRHCSALLNGDGGPAASPLSEVAVIGCWLLEGRGPAGPGAQRGAAAGGGAASSSGDGGGGGGAGCDLAAAAAPWDAAAALAALRRQRWAPRLRRLELQLAGAGAGPPPPVPYTSLLTTAADDVSSFPQLESLAVTWEALALCPEGRAGAYRASASSTSALSSSCSPSASSSTEAASKAPSVPFATMGLGLTVAQAQALLYGSPGLASAELVLGERPGAPLLRLDELLWLLRLRSLRRLRLVLCAACDAATHAAEQLAGVPAPTLPPHAQAQAQARAGPAGSPHGAESGPTTAEPRAGRESENGSGRDASTSVALAGAGRGAGAEGANAEAAAAAEAGGAGAAAPEPGMRQHPPPPPPPEVPSAWLHAELAELLLLGLPGCQSQVVQVRVPA